MGCLSCAGSDGAGANNANPITNAFSCTAPASGASKFSLVPTALVCQNNVIGATAGGSFSTGATCTLIAGSSYIVTA